MLYRFSRFDIVMPDFSIPDLAMTYATPGNLRLFAVISGHAISDP